jgi:hypothetical protein
MKLAQVSGQSLKGLEEGVGLNFAGGNIGDIVSELVKYLFPLAGILLLLYLIFGGFQLMLSRGDPKAAQSAQGKITNALVGFIIVFAAYWIVQIVGKILGIEAITTIFK